MCIKNGQNGTNTRIHPMRQKIEGASARQGERKTGDVVEIEIPIDCTSTGLSREEEEEEEKTTNQTMERSSRKGPFASTCAVRATVDPVASSLDVTVAAAAGRASRSAAAMTSKPISCTSTDGCRSCCSRNCTERAREVADWCWSVHRSGTSAGVPETSASRDRWGRPWDRADYSRRGTASTTWPR